MSQVQGQSGRVSSFVPLPEPPFTMSSDRCRIINSVFDSGALSYAADSCLALLLKAWRPREPMLTKSLQTSYAEAL
jgi:hypothetical protein